MFYGKRGFVVFSVSFSFLLGFFLLGFFFFSFGFVVIFTCVSIKIVNTRSISTILVVCVILANRIVSILLLNILNKISIFIGYVGDFLKVSANIQKKKKKI